MKILGMDSSGMTASVAYVADGVLIAEYTMNHKKTHSQTLLRAQRGVRSFWQAYQIQEGLTASGSSFP